MELDTSPEPAHEPGQEPAPAGAGLGVLEKAMGLLNIVSAARRPMTFTELLRASGLPRATLHRILATLVREGLLRHGLKISLSTSWAATSAPWTPTISSPWRGNGSTEM